MKSATALKENSRSWRRFNVLLNAKYFLEGVNWYRECVIIDISKQGASVNLPIDEKVVLGTNVILEVITKQLENVIFKGKIVWIKQSESTFLIGIKFKKLLDFQVLGKLY